MKQLDPELLIAVDAQMQREYTAQHVYLAAHRAFLDAALPGMAAWAWHAADEEASHAVRFARWLVERGAPAEIGPPGPPPAFYNAPALAVFHEMQALEASVTTAIDILYALAEEKEDYDLCEFLHWFIREQHDSEAELKDIVTLLALVDDEGAGLLEMDRRLGEAAS